MSYQWNEGLSVGYELMDQQHRRLFAINHELAEELAKAGAAKSEVLLKIVGDLMSYTRSHFAEEEALMRQVDFPGFARHKRLHDGLVSMVFDLEAKVGKGELRSVAEFLPSFVGVWLSEHIAVEDHQYARYIKTQPAVQAARDRL